MKKWIIALLSGLLLFSNVNAYAQMQELNKVLVVVNDGVILQSDVDNAVADIHQRAKAAGKNLPSEEILRQQVTDKLVMDELQRQEAVRIGVKIDDAQLNQAIGNIAAQNHKTVPQLQANIEAQGQNYDAFREQIRKEIMISEARNALVRRRINVSPAEIDGLIAMMNEKTNQAVEYNISQIQLEFGEDKKETEKLANEIMQKLNDGEDFSTLAYTYSKGPNALDGGSWGWQRKESLPTILADQITTQGKGAIIGPFRSGIGYHILKINDVKGLQSVAVIEANVRHILIKPSIILSDEAARQELNKFRSQIMSGEKTFGELARKYSQDPGSAVADGELGYQTADTYVPEFKAQVEKLPVGQISQPFKTQFGWHILEVLDRKAVDKTEDAMKNKASEIIFKRKFNEEASAWLQELKASAYIRYMDQPDSAQ